MRSENSCERVRLWTAACRTVALLAAAALAMPGGAVTAMGQDAAAKPGPAPADAEAEPAPEPEAELELLERAPHRFNVVVDDRRFLWGVAGDGSIELTNRCITDGMELFVGAEAFAPEMAAADASGTRLGISGRAGTVSVRRDIFIDRDRGGVRHIDSFTAPDDEALELTIELRHDIREDVDRVYTSEGRDLADGRVEPDEIGLIIQYELVDEGEAPRALEMGPSSAAILFGGARSPARPAVSSSPGAIVFSYGLEIPAGETRSILTWTLQRKLRNPTHPADVFASVFRQGHLIAARVPAALTEGVANFAAGATSDDGFVAPKADFLVGVRRLEERLGVSRFNEAILWLGEGSELNGKVDGQSLDIESRFGKVTVPVEEVAAVQGGGGRGRDHRAYLRDGTVLSGPISAEGLRIKGLQGWEIDVVPDQLEYLLLKLDIEDGAPPPEADLMVALHSGDTLAIEFGPDERLALLTAWGAIEVPAADIESLQYTKRPSPRYRVMLADGAQLTAFLEPRELNVQAARLGGVQIRTTEIEAIWRAGDVPGPPPEDLEEVESFADFGEGVPEDQPVCLLRGGNLVVGSIANETLHVVAGTTVTALRPAEIATMRRSADDAGDLVPAFEIELSGGDLLRGRLQESVVEIQTAREIWRIPVQHFLASRRP